MAQIWLEVTSLLIYGVTDGVRVLGSQAVGNNDAPLSGLWYQTGLATATFLCLPIAASWTQTAVALKAVPHIDPQVVTLASRYAMWSLLWLWPRSAFFVTHKYLQGNNVVDPQLIISAVFVATNIGCNIVLVHTGVPGLFAPLGFIGSPIATAVATWGMLFSLTAYLSCSTRLKLMEWCVRCAQRDLLFTSRTTSILACLNFLV